MSSTGFGFFAKGAASARDARMGRELEAKRVDIAEQSMLDQRKRDMLQQTRDQIAKLTEQAQAVVSNFPAGRDDPRFEQLISEIRTGVATLATRAGEVFPGALDPQSQIAMFDTAIQATPTPLEAAETEAKADVAGARGRVEAVGGSARDIEVLLGLETPLNPTDTRKLQMERDRLEAAGDMRAAREITAQIEKRGAIVGRTEFDVGTEEGFVEGLTTPTTEDVERLRTDLRDNQTSFETATNTLKEVEEAGALAVGFAGAATETISGIVGNLGALGEAINAGFENLTGADLQKLTAARTRMRQGVSAALQDITQEEGNRYTDTERRIAAEVLRGITPSSDINQVISAYQTYFQIINDSDTRNVREIMRGAGINIGTMDALNDEGINALGDILRDVGMAEARIEEIIVQVLQ